MKVSVIIPVWGVEAYLRQCVQSVLSQTHRDLEVILVDDGSPDGCGAICDEYARRDPRVHAIHKENGGLSDARNAGLAAASGEYVLFLDGDDLWSDPGALARLMERIAQSKADVLNFSYVRWFEQTDQRIPYFRNVPPMPALPTKTEQLRYLTDRGLYIASACNKLIRRDLLRGLEFQQGVHSEDILWCARLLLKANSMDFVCENFYLYRQRPGSIHRTVSEKTCADLAGNILACLSLAESAAPAEKDALLRYTAFQYGTFFAVQSMAQRLPRDSIRLLSPYSWILRYHGSNGKLHILHLGCKMLGCEKLCRLIRLLMP